MTFSLNQHGISVAKVLRNPSPAVLYEEALAHEHGTAISSTGALIARSGDKTGRSPKDKRVVSHDHINDDVWWGSVNVGLEAASFDALRTQAVDHLNTCSRLYVIDGFAGWDPRYRVRIRVICERAYHALFMRNMLIRPSQEELENFGEPDYVIYNAGRASADTSILGVKNPTSVSLCFARGEFVILGTEYAGEMKKGVFTIMNYIMPKQDVLSMHCSANEGTEGDVSIFFGLSGTGKTTLSADPDRYLIGDDEHCWSDQGVFNIEGGCYAKAINLDPKAEPEIYNAIRFGAVLENVVYDKDTREVNYEDSSLTENTRCSYPVEFIPNTKIPCTGGHPRNLVFLTCDAFSVLPPVSRLTPAQAMYHFISGYTAKVAGTEVGVTEPEATFSACFGAPFLVWHPTRYAELLAERIREHDVRVWLVNTGWSGGPYGVGKRMSIAHTRAIIDAIHDGSLEKSDTVEDPIFGVQIPTTCPNVPDEVLIPSNTWEDKQAYQDTAAKLAMLFHNNFRTYEDQASEEIRQAAPRVPESVG
ncbi:phosphoenolpyruvate carboxykinase (ATP) [Ectothiorhodospira variabilis]|uniref:phosphoenolpyruvate carboxykinase (ATP) n=1 Tax=Ectothiorhodospira variabilis TaxID=505694 RepID=UPI001EFC1AA4|nr:phosphoenolpyruvate carboxykinase (ATP) [Ectothiorhodospira variabilis]MCG5493040.1 phosphoenolpyruvate carboxykinase (ATP) [Ectothiorhodospira variabilis]MCG5497239.1 phosphoenolpyruvate carboxykinase (ATP) [Ectothiorhodospira variabilis]MCG5502369.1 phosphoenolpyruvate carboxykinase (ATP) [Ectothiorhodospira variabilis]MCG5505865.1 phosphoenolpyruvate carboxykinase (ATP) [Ectothiorhodospira variabilis]